MARLVPMYEIAKLQSSPEGMPGQLAALDAEGKILAYGHLEVEVVGDVDALGRATTDVRFVIENRAR